MIGNSILDIGTSKWGVDEVVESVGTSTMPSHFMLPAVQNVMIQNFMHNCNKYQYQPAEFCRTNFSAEKGQDYDQDIKFMKGTTTLAFKV